MRFSINLLPPKKKEALRQGMLLAYFQTMVFVVFIFALFVAGTLVSVRMMIKSDYESTMIASEAVTGGDTAEVAKSVHELNNLLRQADSRQRLFVPWGEVIGQLVPLIPAGTRIDKIRIDEKGQINLSGVAPTREDSLELMRRLKTVDFIAEVSSPLSNILQKTNVKFDFEMKFVGFKKDATDL